MFKIYCDEYFNDICKITKKCWHGELILNPKTEEILYELLPKYSLINKVLSFVDYSDKVDAFIFAGFRDDYANVTNWLNNIVKELNEEEKKIVNLYFNYLELNHNKVISHMKNKDVYLSLLASTKKNSGASLLDYLKKIAYDNNSDIYLWTDETCNYKYYEAKGFKLVEEYYVTLLDKRIKTYIYTFECSKINRKM